MTAPTHSSALTERVASLDARMGGLESNVKGINDSLVVLANKIDRRSETPWESIWAACGVVLTIVSIVGWMALSPLKETEAEHSHSLAAYAQTYMAKDDIKDLFKSQLEVIKEVEKGAKDDLNAFSDQLDRRAKISNDRRDDYQHMADKRSQDNADRIAALDERTRENEKAIARMLGSPK